MGEKTAIHLRFDTPEDHTDLVAEAKAAGRSLNAHINYLIRTHPERKPKPRKKK